MSLFQKATKEQSKLRLAISGPAGAGKTYSALRIGTFLGKTAFIDTERGSARLYADRFDFDVLELTTYEPASFVQAIKAAEDAGYEVIVIDSLSHAWSGEGGVLDQVDRIAKLKAQKSNKWGDGDKFDAWKEGGKLHQSLIDAILGSKCHIICCMRAKMEYVRESGANGKATVRKVGMAPVQRDQLEFEFTMFGEMNQEHELMITKTRIAEFEDQIIVKPGEEFAAKLKEFLEKGVAPTVRVQPDLKPASEFKATTVVPNTATNPSGDLLDSLWDIGKYKGTKVRDIPASYWDWVFSSNGLEQANAKHPNFNPSVFEQASVGYDHTRGQQSEAPQQQKIETSAKVLDAGEAELRQIITEAFEMANAVAELGPENTQKLRQDMFAVLESKHGIKIDVQTKKVTPFAKADIPLIKQSLEELIAIPF